MVSLKLRNNIWYAASLMTLIPFLPVNEPEPQNELASQSLINNWKPRHSDLGRLAGSSFPA